MPALAIDGRDNVATALRAVAPGETITIGSQGVTTCERIPAGHKLALVDIAAGSPVVKYGSPIGLALVAIAAGAHVHSHNLASTRGRGDLAGAAHGRLAEPDDDTASGPAGDEQQP